MSKFYALVAKNNEDKFVFIIDEETGLTIMSPDYNTICRHQVSFASNFPHREFRVKEITVEGCQGMSLRM